MHGKIIIKLLLLFVLGLLVLGVAASISRSKVTTACGGSENFFGSLIYDFSHFGLSAFSDAGHHIAVSSETPEFTIQIKYLDLLSSKLEEIDFWNEDGVLIIDAKPRFYAQPKNLCIVLTDQVQQYDQYADEQTGEIFRSTSSRYDAETDTVILYVHMNKGFYQKNNLDGSALGSSVTYNIMSTLFSISLPPPTYPVDLSERYRDEESFLSAFKFDPKENNDPVFSVEYTQSKNN